MSRRLLVLGWVCVVAAMMLLACPAVAASSPPLVSTGPVTEVGPTGATVAGAVNPNGLATSWYVEYGPTTAYGSKTASADAGSGTDFVAVSASLTGLQAGTSYHYRFSATSKAGTAVGMDGVLATTAKPQVVTGAVASVTAASAVLHGTVNPGGRATVWWFEYGTSTGYGSDTPHTAAGMGTTAVNVQAAVSGLGPGRTYHFRVVATSDAGTSVGADQTFLAAAAPTVAVNGAAQVQDDSVQLSGTVTPNGAATSWYFEYGTTTAYGSRTAATAAGTGTTPVSVSVQVRGLAHSTVYHFRLAAANAVASITSADQSFVTSGPPMLQTGSPSSVGVIAATLSGSVDPCGHATTWYFEYGVGTAYGAQTQRMSIGPTAGRQQVTAAVSNLNPATVYHFRLVAFNSSGTTTAADATFTTSPPTLTFAPAGMTVVYGSEVDLSGTVSSGQAGRTVTLFAQRLDETTFVAVTTTLTQPGGQWRIAVHPTVGTIYKVSCDGGTSPAGSVGVRPRVSLHALSRRRFEVTVFGGRSFVGRTVQLQRRIGGRWVTIARGPLGRRSAITFHPSLPRGRSTLRAAMSVNQAGVGYLAGFSPVFGYRTT